MLLARLNLLPIGLRNPLPPPYAILIKCKIWFGGKVLMLAYLSAKVKKCAYTRVSIHVCAWVRAKHHVALFTALTVM